MKRYRHILWNCIRNYRFHSIFIKNLILILSVIMLPFVCILAVSYYSYDQIQRSEERAYQEERMIQIQKDVEGLFSEIRNKAIMLGGDSEVELFYLAESIENDTFYDVKDIFDYVSLSKVSTDIVDDIYVYSPAAQTVISMAGRYKYEAFADPECLDLWRDNDEMYQFEYIKRKISRKNRENICFYYTTRHASGRKGVVVFNINLDKLDKKLDYGKNVDIVIAGGGQILYDSTMERNGTRIESTEELKQQIGKEIVVSNSLDQFGLEIILHIDSQPLNEKLGSIRSFMFVFVGVMLVVSITLVFYISLKIFDPIKEIMDALESEPEADERKILQNKNELSYIRDSVYTTISRNKDIEKELLERIIMLKKAQSVALQAQINPHFINNTLETINWMAIGYLGDDNEVSEMINCLSQLLRISLQDTDTFVTLRGEIEYAQKYLFIQQKRLGDSFDVIFSIPQELEDCKLIKMVLQPLIENAIKYGIKPYDNHGVLKVEAVREQEAVCISVRDSGLGLNPQQVEEVNNSIRKTVIKENSHIGLSNVNQRIKLSFGEEYGVSFNSKIGMGTVVTLKVPYKI